jgi:hypothetical protein
MQLSDYVTHAAMEETEQEREIRLLEDAERERAYAATSKALSSYRWWGFTNILFAFRMWCTSVRLRLGMKLWP